MMKMKMMKMMCSSVTRVVQRKNSEFLTGILNPWPSRYQLGTLTTELQVTYGELGQRLTLKTVQPNSISETHIVISFSLP